MMHTRLDCLINSMAAVVQQQHRGAYVHKQRRTYISEVFVVNSYPPPGSDSSSGKPEETGDM